MAPGNPEIEELQHVDHGGHISPEKEAAVVTCHVCGQTVHQQDECVTTLLPICLQFPIKITEGL